MSNGPVYQLFHVFNLESGAIAVRPALKAPPVFQHPSDMEDYLKHNSGKDAILRRDWDDKNNGGPKRFSLSEDLRLVGTGAYLWAQRPDCEDEPVQIVAVKTHGPSEGKLTQPSFLIQNSDILFLSLGEASIPTLRQREMESSLNFAIKDGGDHLKTPVIVPEQYNKNSYASILSGFGYSRRINNASAYLRKIQSPYAEHSFEPFRAPLKHNPLDVPYYRPIEYQGIHGEVLETEEALISDSGTNLNIQLSLVVDISAGVELVLFDPEGYNRDMQAITRGGMFAMCAAGKGSVPMTAHCKDVCSRPQGPDVKYARYFTPDI